MAVRAVHRRGKRLPPAAQAFKEFLLKDAITLLRAQGGAKLRAPRLQRR